MKFGKATILAAAVLGATASQALSTQGVPLRNTGAVVVNWNAPAKTHVVVAGNGKVYVIHSLRRYRVGTRVRIRGVKWGRLGLGIKWGFRPRGIKWGIRLASNGTYFAGMTPYGRATKVRLRGTVVRRYRRGVAVSVRGATFTMHTTSGAQWTSVSNLNAGAVGEVGSQVVFDVRPTAIGTAVVTRALEVVPSKPGATIPFAGTIVSVDPVEGSVVVNASTDPTLPMTFTLTVPASADLSDFPVGLVVTGSAVTSPLGEPELFAKQIADNSSVEAADDPAGTVNMPLPPLDRLRLARDLRLAWIRGNDEAKFSSAGEALFVAQRHQLRRVERAIMRDDNTLALDRLTVFIVQVTNANLPEGSPQKIDPVFQEAILAQARILLGELTNAVLNAGGTPGGGGGAQTDGTNGLGNGSGQSGGSNGHSNGENTENGQSSSHGQRDNGTATDGTKGQNAGMRPDKASSAVEEADDTASSGNGHGNVSDRGNSVGHGQGNAQTSPKK